MVIWLLFCHDRLLRFSQYIQRRENGEKNRYYIEYYSDDKYRNIIWYDHIALSVTIRKVYELYACTIFHISHYVQLIHFHLCNYEISWTHMNLYGLTLRLCRWPLECHVSCNSLLQRTSPRIQLYEFMIDIQVGTS